MSGCALAVSQMSAYDDSVSKSANGDKPNCQRTATFANVGDRRHLPQKITLGQSRDLYRTYQQQIVNCALEIEKMLRDFEPRTAPVERPLPPDRKRNRAGSKRRRKRASPSRIRSAYRNLQALRSGCHSDSRLRGERVAPVQ